MRVFVPAGPAVFVDLGSGMRAEYQPRQRRKAAGAIEVGLVAEVLRRADTGWISLDDPYIVRRGDLVGGTRSLQFQLCAAVPLREVVRLTIVQSDNVAANHLLEPVGRARVNAAPRPSSRSPSSRDGCTRSSSRDGRGRRGRCARAPRGLIAAPA